MVVGSWREKRVERELLALTSQDFLWGSKDSCPNKASFLDAENDLERRMKVVMGFKGLGLEVEEKRDLIVAARGGAGEGGESLAEAGRAESDELLDGVAIAAEG